MAVDPMIISAIIVGIPTSILVIITFLYMRETRLIRQSTQHPIFSIAPTSYTLGGTFHRLLFQNSGQTAINIKVDCIWNNPETNSSETKKFFIVSLGSKDRAILDGIPIANIVKVGSKLTIKFECKDSKDNDYSDEFEVNFGKLKNRTIAYQDDYNQSISDSLNDISSRMRDLKRGL